MPSGYMPMGSGPGQVPYGSSPMQLPSATNYNPSSINNGVPSIFGQQGGGMGTLGQILSGLGGGAGILGAILGMGQQDQRLSDLQGLLQGDFSPENWAAQNAKNAKENAYWGDQQKAWQGLQNVGNLGMQMAQQGPTFGTEGAQAVAPGQAMLAQNFQQLSNFDPKEMKQDRNDARTRMSTPSQYVRGGATGAALQDAASARQQRNALQPAGFTSSAAGQRAENLAQGADTMKALQTGVQEQNRDIGLSADLAKNINDQQLRGKLGATNAAIGHTQAGVAGVNADTQRGLGAMNARTGALNAAGDAYGRHGDQATTSAMGTKVDVKDQYTALQDQLNAAQEAANQSGGLFSSLLGGAFKMIPGLDKLGSIPGLSNLLQGAGGLANFLPIPGLGQLGGAALSGLGSYLGQRR